MTTQQMIAELRRRIAKGAFDACPEEFEELRWDIQMQIYNAQADALKEYAKNGH